MKREVGFTECAGYTCLEDLKQATKFASTSGINLEYCGHEQCYSGFQFGPYVRKNYVIHTVMEGKGVFSVGGKKYELERGKAFLIYPGEETWYRADDEEPWYYMWIGFQGYRCEEYLKHMGFSKDNPVVEIREADRVKEYMLHMLSARKLTVEDELIRMSQLLQILALFIKENRISGKKQIQDYPAAVYVRYAIDYMQIHYREKVKIDNIADIIGISRSYLAGMFKKELGISPQEYLIHLRLEHAAEMLKSTTEPINIVAFQCGYPDALSFSKAFKRRYGMSPKEYRLSEVEIVTISEKGGYKGRYPL